MKNWKEAVELFHNYLRLEKGLSKNSIEAYLRDVAKLNSFIQTQKTKPTIESIDLNFLQRFLEWVNELGMTARSQARMISGIRAFFKFLRMDEIISNDPSDLLDLPRIGQKLPEVLSVQEIDTIVSVIDLSKAEGHRNKAIIETMYGCGLRVSELISLQISNLHFKEKYVRVLGKGNKERLIPIGATAIKEIKNYFSSTRNKISIAKGHEDFVFLNRRGKNLSRVMIFTIVKDLAERAEIKRNISPHTFRHSFATHLIEGGADLRAIQDMLGHESIITTEIYTHLDKTFLRETMYEFHPRSEKYLKGK